MACLWNSFSAVFLNQSEHNHHQLLRDFEERNRTGRCTPLQFISGLTPPPSIAIQVEIIAIDIELSLSRGVKPRLQAYLRDFPNLSGGIRDVYADVVDDFIKNFSPVREKNGGFISTADYEIGEEIARGGMGVVYFAVQKSIGREVALKVLFLKRDDIFTEAKRIAKLNHRNICRIYDIGEIGKFPYMTMELVQGETLRERMERGRVSIADAIGIVGQTADALSAAHRVNLVHFDVKPANILVAANDHVWLTDFGIAEHLSEVALNTGISQPVSPVYCAPEQLSFQYGERGFQSDIYSLGLVFYELLTGRRAYDGDVAEIVEQLKFDPPRRPRDYDQEIEPELERICLKAIAKHSKDRFASMSDFQATLQSFVERFGIVLS